MWKAMSEKKSIIAEALSTYGEANRRKIRNKLIIATKISRRLRELGMTQKEFAEKIGKSAPEVSDILSGDRNLTIDTMSDIESLLDMRLLDTTLLDNCKIERECTVNVKTSEHYQSYYSATEPFMLQTYVCDNLESA